MSVVYFLSRLGNGISPKQSPTIHYVVKISFVLTCGKNFLVVKASFIFFIIPSLNDGL